jgi:ribosomal-protein-alanine N-acetyltransferase
MNPYLLTGLESERLLFRKVEPSDFNACLPFFQHPLSHQYWETGNKDPQTLCSEWLNKQQWRYESGSGGALALVDKATGTFVGWCGLLIQEVDGVQEVEVGYSIMPEYWGRGYATEAARKCMDEAFGRRLTNSIISIIQIHNIPSQRVAEKNGMRIDCQTTHHGNPVFIYRTRHS